MIKRSQRNGSCPATLSKLGTLFLLCAAGFSILRAHCSLASCVAAPQVFREHGVLYAAPYDHEVRVKIGSITGQRIGDAIRTAQEALALDENAELPGMFNFISPSWWLRQLNRGGIQVERCAWQHLEFERVDADYVVKEGDRARLMIHVHERAAPDVEIPIVYEDRDFLAVSKPASVDLTKNPGYGSVRLSVLGMLEDMGYTNIYPAHRIDKPVSGVLCLGKNKKALSRLMRCIRNRKVQKTYLARTVGGPDEGGFRIQAPLDVVLDNSTNKNVAVASASGKRSESIVEDVFARHGDSTATLGVRILTGRYHQVRCHLQHAGWPIANDPVYGGVPQLGQEIFNGTRARQMIEEHQIEGCTSCEYFRNVATGVEPCPRLDPTIWLHSWRYNFPTLGLSFEAPPPEWAAIASQALDRFADLLAAISELFSDTQTVAFNGGALFFNLRYFIEAQRGSIVACSCPDTARHALRSACGIPCSCKGGASERVAVAGGGRSSRRGGRWQRYCQVFARRLAVTGWGLPFGLHLVQQGMWQFTKG
ncbi:Bifunctional protein RIB2 [Symbiodinium microadriaticum]|uniref:Bifunctional protein RIB2 n=1 Tax=Symbiodinium microadriaticum TaxID=2951 RepID=A0A1Q9D4A5_SYMMI|nr:Bifunctional protein RIB2 [Symbiodinium microadriaticum]